MKKITGKEIAISNEDAKKGKTKIKEIFWDKKTLT